jgi:hypothetical protein
LRAAGFAFAGLDFDCVERVGRTKFGGRFSTNAA